MKALIAFLFMHYSLASFASGHLDLGAGPLGVIGNHYRGSDQTKLWVFPLPYFSYRSEKLEADPSFVRGILYNSDTFAFKLSFVPGLKVESKENRARSGMPTLDYTIEAGPMLIFKLWHADDKSLAINFEWPLRESFATDLSFLKHVGFFTVPYINIIHTPQSMNGNWQSELSLSPMFADHKYHQHYYGVDHEFVRADRPFYQATGGYSGFQTAWVLNWRIKKNGTPSVYSLGLFTRGGL